MRSAEALGTSPYASAPGAARAPAADLEPLVEAAPLPHAAHPGEALAQAVEEAVHEAEEAAPGPIAADARVLRLQHSLRRVRRQNRRLRKRVQALELKVETLQESRPGLGA